MGYDALVWRLCQDYPEMRFRLSTRFKYRPPRTIYYEKCSESVASEAEQNSYCLQLLHELGHALCGHCDYKMDCERVKIERQAWDKAQELCTIYNIYYDEDSVEAQLDTYRDWLHQRSRCPECGLTRYQDGMGRYHCPGCEMLQ